MGVVSTTQNFTNGAQGTATKLNNITNNSSFDSSAVDDSTTQISSGAIIVKDGGILPAKLSTGGISWNSNGAHTISGSTPTITLTDSDTGADCQIDASNSAGRLSLSSDENNEVSGSLIECKVDGVAQVDIKDGSIVPRTDNDIDLGSGSLEFKDLYIDGTAEIDSLNADTADINGGTVDGAVIGGNNAAAITGTTGQFNTSLAVGTDTDKATISGILIKGDNWVLPSQAGGTEATTTVTVTGASLNDEAIVCPREDPGPWRFEAWVSSSDTVTVSAYNAGLEAAAVSSFTFSYSLLVFKAS